MIKENYYIEKIDEFNKTFGKDLGNTTPTLVSAKKAKFVGDMIEEELEEYREAVANDDLVEIADALVDLLYFIGDGILAYGLQDRFKKLFDEVQDSNMSKADDSLEDARKTLKAVIAKEKVTAQIHEINGKFVVRRYHDDKVRKSVNFKEPNLKPILDGD